MVPCVAAKEGGELVEGRAGRPGGDTRHELISEPTHFTNRGRADTLHKRGRADSRLSSCGESAYSARLTTGIRPSSAPLGLSMPDSDPQPATAADRTLAGLAGYDAAGCMYGVPNHNPCSYLRRTLRSRSGPSGLRKSAWQDRNPTPGAQLGRDRAEALRRPLSRGHPTQSTDVVVRRK